MSVPEHDPAFDSLPVGNTFFKIWRVKQFSLYEVPKENYGNFYNGDCYIVICCSDMPGTGYAGMPVKPLLNTIGYTHIHFWIGSESTQDEAGVAAIKTVQLDDHLGGYPIQHREVEGAESKMFLSYFRNGIRLLKGGFESGFNKVEDKVEPALFQVKGKKRPMLQQLNEIKWSQMNRGDVFVLLTPKYIYVWTGAKSNRMERTAAIRIANDMKNEMSRFKLSVLVAFDGKETDQLAGQEYGTFDEYLPLAQKDTMIEYADDFDWAKHDEQFEKKERQFVRLYRCQETKDQIDIKYVKDGPLNRPDLDSNDTFIVDNREEGIWVWVGKNATKQERSSAMKYAMELIKTKGYSAKTEVTKVNENGESTEFRGLFASWKLEKEEKSMESRLFRLTRNGTFAQVIQYEQDDLEEDSIMILDTVAKIYVWISTELQETIKDENQLKNIAQRYVKQDKSGRTATPDMIEIVKQGKEDDYFKTYFKTWK